MRGRIVEIIAWRDVRAAVRGRWFVIGAVAFALLAVAAAELGMAGAERWGVSTVSRTTAAMLNLVLLFVPLLGLSLGASSVSGEREAGVLGYLVAQPVRRSEVFWGKAAGLTFALTLSLGLGFGLAAVWIGFSGSVGGAAFAALAGGAWLLGAATVGLGLWIAMLARNRAQALALSTAAWLVLVFLCDFGVLALAAARIFGAGTLFVLSVVNPLQAAKTTVALALSERLEVLGPAGVYAVKTMGRPVLAALLIASVLLWAFGSAFGAYRRFRKEVLA